MHRDWNHPGPGEISFLKTILWLPRVRGESPVDGPWPGPPGTGQSGEQLECGPHMGHGHSREVRGGQQSCNSPCGTELFGTVLGVNSTVTEEMNKHLCLIRNGL